MPTVAAIAGSSAGGGDGAVGGGGGGGGGGERRRADSTTESDREYYSYCAVAGSENDGWHGVCERVRKRETKREMECKLWGCIKKDVTGGLETNLSRICGAFGALRVHACVSITPIWYNSWYMKGMRI